MKRHYTCMRRKNILHDDWYYYVVESDHPELEVTPIGISRADLIRMLETMANDLRNVKYKTVVDKL